MPQDLKKRLSGIYRRLFSRFGRQRWWPGETPFEVMVGAILTQNIAWTNVSRAIENLRRDGLLDPVLLDQVPLERLASLIRPSGYFNQKAKRLKTFVQYYLAVYSGDIRRFRRVPPGKLREELLALSGIGPETADSILLYAAQKPVFVVDAYTRRILARHSFIPWEAPYSEIQALFMRYLPHKATLFNEYHALIVALGKELCRRTRPRCYQCPLRRVGKLRLETSPDLLK